MIEARPEAASRLGAALIRFGDIEVDFRLGCVLAGGVRTELGSRALKLLKLFTESPGVALSREELIATVWRGAVVEDGTLSHTLSVLRRALGDDDHKLIRTLARRGYIFMPPVPIEVLDPAPASPSTPVVSEQLATPAKSRSLAPSLALGTLIALVLAITMYLWSTRPGLATQRPSVAILGFKNSTGRADLDWLSTALTEMLTTELAGGEQVRVVPSELVDRTRADLSMTEAGSVDPAHRARLKANLNTDLLLRGSFLAGGAPGAVMRLDVRIEDTVSGEILGAASSLGAEADIGALVGHLGTDLRRQLGIDELSGDDVRAVRLAMPANPIAARLYAEGLTQMRRFALVEAQRSLQAAVEADPSSALVRAALSQAWSRLGYDEKAETEAAAANDLAAPLSRELRLVVEATWREMQGDWTRAIEVWRSLVTFFPDNLEYGLHLSAAQRSGGRGNDALATVARLILNREADAVDPRIDLEEAFAAEAVSDFRRQLVAANRVAEKAVAQQARQLQAQGLLQQCNAYRRLGELAPANASCMQARSLLDALNDRVGLARANTQLATVLYDRSEIDAAKAAYAEALAIFRTVGDQSGIAGVLNRQAILVDHQGDPAAAKALFEASHSIYEKIGRKRMAAQLLNNIATTAIELGDLPGAESLYRRSAAILREQGDVSATAAALGNLGDVLLRQSDGTPAALHAAEEQINEALASWTAIGDVANAAISHLQLAEIAIEQGAAERAEREAIGVAEQARREGRVEDEVLALSVLARALLARGMAAQARETAEKGDALLPVSVNQELHLDLRTTAARALAQSGSTGDVATAVNRLQAALSEADQAAMVLPQFEIRLALGEIGIRTGDRAAAKLALIALERDARAMSYHRIAHKAARLRVANTPASVP